MSDSSLKRLTLIMAANCVRNTVIENYHARGSLSQEDMKVFNKQVADKLYTFLRFLFNGSVDEREALMKATDLLYPRNWDQPVVDADIKKAVKFGLNDRGETGKNSSLLD